METKYPQKEFLLIFIIPGQHKTMYYKKVMRNTHIFTLNNNNITKENTGHIYKPIYDFIKNNDLFNMTPPNKCDSVNINHNCNMYVKHCNVSPFRDDN